MMSAEIASGMSDMERSVEEHRDALLRYAWSCLGSLPDAQDVVQTALMNALVALRKGNRPQRLKAWLFGIAHNEICAQKRKAAATGRIAREPVDGAHRTNDPLIQELREALAAIPEPYGPILALRCVQGFSVQEIAELVDRPAGTVKVYLSRALSMLRERLAPRITEFRKWQS